MVNKKYSAEEWRALPAEKKCEIKAKQIQAGKITFVVDYRNRKQKEYVIELLDAESVEKKQKPFRILESVEEVKKFVATPGAKCTNTETLNKVFAYL